MGGWASEKEVNHIFMGLDVGDVLGPVHPMSILAEQEIEESIEIE